MKRLIPILFFAILTSSVCFGHYELYLLMSPSDSTCFVEDFDLPYGFSGSDLHIDYEPLFFIYHTDSFYEWDWGYEINTECCVVGKHRISNVYLDFSHIFIDDPLIFPDSLDIYSVSETTPYVITFENSNQIALTESYIDSYSEVYYFDEFCNSPRHCAQIGDYYYVTSADINPIDSTYGQGMLWKLNESFEVVDSLEIGMNPTHLIGPIGTPYASEIHVLCTGDNESHFGTVYIVCRDCFEIIDSLWLGGNPEYLAYNNNNGYVYACVSNPDSVGGGKLLYYDSRRTEVLCDITSSGNELFGSNFNRYHLFGPDEYELYIPSIDSNWVEIIQAGRTRITERRIENTGLSVSDIVLHYFDSGIEENIAPKEYDIFSVFPNPFNSSCIFDIPGDADIEIFDIEGKLIENINGNLWMPESHVQSGVYLAKMTYDNETYSKTIIYLK